MKNLIFLIFILLISCTSQKALSNNETVSKTEVSQKLPKNFSFIYSHSDDYNSKTNQFSRFYEPENDKDIDGKTKTIKVKLTKEELLKVYNSFKVNNFEEMPEDLSNSNNMSKPVLSYKLVYKLDKIIKKSKFYNWYC